MRGYPRRRWGIHVTQWKQLQHDAHKRGTSGRLCKWISGHFRQLQRCLDFKTEGACQDVLSADLAIRRTGLYDEVPRLRIAPGPVPKEPKVQARKI